MDLSQTQEEQEDHEALIGAFLLHIERMIEIRTKSGEGILSPEEWSRYASHKTMAAECLHDLFCPFTLNERKRSPDNATP